MLVRMRVLWVASGLWDIPDTAKAIGQRVERHHNRIGIFQTALAIIVGRAKCLGTGKMHASVCAAARAFKQPRSPDGAVLALINRAASAIVTI